MDGRSAGLMGWSRRPERRGVVAPSWATWGGRAVLSGVGGRAVLGYVVLSRRPERVPVAPGQGSVSTAKLYQLWAYPIRRAVDN